MTKHTTILGQTSVPIALKDEADLPIIWVNDFDEDTSRDFFYDFLSYLSDDSIKNIVIYIDSNGGHIDALFSMAELIENSSKPVTTVNAGKSFSAGAILFALGTEGHRWVAPASRTMFHNIHLTALGKDVEEAAQYIDMVSRMNDDWVKRVVKKSDLTQKQFNSLLKEANGELFLTAKQMLKYGFADHVGLPLIKEIKQWTLET